MEGAPKFAESQTLPDVDYAAFASSLGLEGIAVDKPDEIGPAWDRALAADRPGAAGRPHRPERPADPAARHASSRRRTPAEAILKGDENRWGVIREGVKTKVQEFLPHSGD